MPGRKRESWVKEKMNFVYLEKHFNSAGLIESVFHVDDKGWYTVWNIYYKNCLWKRKIAYWLYSNTRLTQNFIFAVSISRVCGKNKKEIGFPARGGAGGGYQRFTSSFDRKEKKRHLREEKEQTAA